MKKASKLIREIEAQVEDPQAKTVYWYTVKHSEAEDLASVIARVYDLLISENASFSQGNVMKAAAEAKKNTSNLIVTPPTVSPGSRTSHKTADGRNNFIVDPKTGSIIMVVEQDALPKIKELLKKLDVPKKMVQIEVLLFEKKISNQNKSGLNLLRLGHSASNTRSEGMTWNDLGRGIMEFLISRSKGSGIPAYDLAYHFLLGQEDVQINASPSVTTVNQTPATIAIVEEISLNTGTSLDSKKDSFTRAQYGITMQITPTINAGDESDTETQFITLDTDITFDTTKNGSGDRPDVTRRHIQNHVRIPDGQTVILGGLRRKNCQDTKDSIPFLGEIPGLGKLFSTTDLIDSNTEMFVFITPKIINDPVADAERNKREMLKKRPGDISEYIYELTEAKNRERKKLFEGGITSLFGRQGTFSTPIREAGQEYDGR